MYQADGYGKSEVLSELRFGISYMPKPEQREAARSLIHKLESMPEKECLELIQDIRKNYRVPGGPKTIGELLAETRQKSGAERLKGHDIMALERFDDTTRHMIILMCFPLMLLSGIKVIRCACSLLTQVISVSLKARKKEKSNSKTMQRFHRAAIFIMTTGIVPCNKFSERRL